MATFNNGESGLSVRTKINNVLQHADGTAGELVINEAGADVDFRVESDTNASALFVDGATGNIGIGTGGPSARLHAYTAGGGTVARLQTGTTANGNFLDFYNASSARQGLVGFIDSANLYIHNDAAAAIIFDTSDTERMRIDASGNLGLGATPSAWGNAVRVFDVGSLGAFAGSIGGAYAIFNAYLEANNTTWRYKGANAACYYSAELGAHKWYTAPYGTAGNAITFTQAMTLDASGNLLVGTTSSSAKLHVQGSAPEFRLYSDTTTGSTINFMDQVWQSQIIGTGGNLLFKTGGTTERMRIDYLGNLLVGTTNSSGTATGSSVNTGFVAESGGTFYNQVNAGPNSYMSKASGFTNGAMFSFWVNNSQVGSITVTSSDTAYNTSSDYRLKESIQPIFGASDRVLALNPVNFAWKADGSRTDGFIAHEVQEIAPYAVTGEKDGEEMQGMDHSKLVPLLTAALQEALAEIALLKARLDAANL